MAEISQQSDIELELWVDDAGLGVQPRTSPRYKHRLMVADAGAVIVAIAVAFLHPGCRQTRASIHRDRPPGARSVDPAWSRPRGGHQPAVPGTCQRASDRGGGEHRSCRQHLDRLRRCCRVRRPVRPAVAALGLHSRDDDRWDADRGTACCATGVCTATYEWTNDPANHHRRNRCPCDRTAAHLPAQSGTWLQRRRLRRSGRRSGLAAGSSVLGPVEDLPRIIRATDANGVLVSLASVHR